MSVYERSRKNSHLDTIWYEITMVTFCYREFKNRQECSEPERNLLIEGFLLHYRNIVEFFSGTKHRKATDAKPADLSTADSNVWAGRSLTSEELSSMQVPARELEDTYFGDISQFLQHCTERRFAEFKGWKVDEMAEKLKPILSAFSKSFPSQSQPHRT